MILQLGGCDARRDTILGSDGGFLHFQLPIACLGLALTVLEFFSRLSRDGKSVVASIRPATGRVHPDMHYKTGSGVCSKILLCFLVFVRRRRHFEGC